MRIGRAAVNQVWSIDFMFDRTVEGRVIKCLTIVDDATHVSVAIEPKPARADTAHTDTGSAA